jgi:hypothetical protein
MFPQPWSSCFIPFNFLCISFPQPWLMIIIVSYFEFFIMHVQEDLDNSLHRASRDQQKPNPVIRIGETQVSHLFVWLKWQVFFTSHLLTHSLFQVSSLEDIIRSMKVNKSIIYHILVQMEWPGQIALECSLRLENNKWRIICNNLF